MTPKPKKKKYKKRTPEHTELRKRPTGQTVVTGMTPHACQQCGAELRTWSEREEHFEFLMAYGGCKSEVLSLPEAEFQRRERLRNSPDMKKMRERLMNEKLGRR